MPYNIENIFICLAAPFLLAALGTNTGNRKNYIFIVLGFVCCIISAYLNTFFSVLYGAQETSAVLEISPVIEETVKLIPLLFGLIVFELQPQEGDNIIFNIAVGFATFENICYLIQNGAENFTFLAFSTQNISARSFKSSKNLLSSSHNATRNTKPPLPPLFQKVIYKKLYHRFLPL